MPFDLARDGRCRGPPCSGRASFRRSPPAAPLKVLISADMEGVGGVSTWSVQASAKGREYEKFRELMTREVNAAVEGAFDGRRDGGRRRRLARGCPEHRRRAARPARPADSGVAPAARDDAGHRRELRRGRLRRLPRRRGARERDPLALLQRNDRGRARRRDGSRGRLQRRDRGRLRRAGGVPLGRPDDLRGCEEAARADRDRRRQGGDRLLLRVDGPPRGGPEDDPRGSPARRRAPPRDLPLSRRPARHSSGSASTTSSTRRSSRCCPASSGRPET